MNSELPFFRLPQELREQIYSYLFDKDEPYIQTLNRNRYNPILYPWSHLMPPPHCTGALRLWIENGDLITQRTWHNRRLAIRVHDRAAILRTCRRVYEDASEYLYGKTEFTIFSSQRYERRFGRESCVSDWDAEEERVAQLVTDDAKRYFPYDRWPYRPGADFWKYGEVPRTLWTPACYELMGTISSCAWLRRVMHLRITVYAKKPEDLGKMVTMLQKLRAVLPEAMRTFKLDLEFNEPRQRSIRPYVDEEGFQQLVAVIAQLRALGPKELRVNIMVNSDWWIAAFRKRRMDVLNGLCRPGSVYPSFCSIMHHRLYTESLDRWRIPYCDSLQCEQCLKWRLAAAWLGEVRWVRIEKKGSRWLWMKTSG